MKNPFELDIFTLETQSRKFVHDLVQPLVTKMNEDRESMISLDYRNQSFEKRLSQLEYLQGVNHVKPQVFVDI